MVRRYHVSDCYNSYDLFSYLYHAFLIHLPRLCPSLFLDAPFNSSYPIPYTIEYKWRGTKDEDRPLGVITLFLISIVLFIGILAVIYTTYDRDQPIPIKRTPGSGSGSSSMYSSGAGIHVKRRPSGGSDKKARY